MTTLEVFEDLTDDEAQAIFSSFPVLAVPSGEPVVAQGSTDRAVYVVLKGGFSVHVLDDEGATHTLAELDEGAVFGELSFLDDLPRSATVTAMRDAEVLRMDRDGFDRLVQERPSAASKIYRDLARVVTRRLRLANERVIRGA